MLGTLAEVKAEINSRLVFGIGCVPLIMIGIALGIIKKDGHLLTAFGVSAVPATILIVCIMTGKAIIKNPSSQFVSGEIVIWAGIAILSVLAGIVYRRLLKH
jgi:ethanolamine transporter EutH